MADIWSSGQRDRHESIEEAVDHCVEIGAIDQSVVCVTTAVEFQRQYVLNDSLDQRLKNKVVKESTCAAMVSCTCI